MVQRRRATSFRPFEAFQQKRWYKRHIKLLMIIIIVSGYFLYQWISTPQVQITPKGQQLKEFFDSQNVKKKAHKETVADKRFLANLMPRPSPLPPSGQRVLDQVTAQRLALLEKSRYIVLSNLQFCEGLNGALVDAFVPLKNLGGSIAQKNPTVNELAVMVDSTAQKAYNEIFDFYGDVDPHEAQRYACYATAEGSNPLTNLTTTPWTVKLNPQNYFFKVIPAIRSSDSRIPGNRRKYKLAYLVMIRENSGFQQFTMLIDNLDNGDAIFLVHVEKGKERLYSQVSDFIQDRNREKSKIGNVFLARHRYANIYGHVSLVYSYLSGFFELRDLADWDFVINLSNYDWPLRRNHDIHRILSKRPGGCYIDYWVDTEALAHRTMRPHLGNVHHVNNYHPPELSITNWPFTFWQSFKQMQWMILSPQAVDHFRTDHMAQNYLAVMEHAYMPEETYFATVLFNSPQFKPLLIPDKKRFVREHSGSWIGWKDRHLFPPGALDPAFLFIRPINALGNFYGETKLIEWIRQKHLDVSEKAACRREQLGYRDECLREIISTVAHHNEVILVPVNGAMYSVAMNLLCSLGRADISNVVFWALDVEVHERLVNEGHMSFILPNLRGNPQRLHVSDKDLINMLRSKPVVLQKFVNAGFNVWYLDADMVVMREFRTKAEEYKKDPFKADIILSVANADLIPPTLQVDQIPTVNAGIMYFRNTENSKQFIDDAIKQLESNEKQDDQYALRYLIGHSKKIQWTGIGTRSVSEIYPDGKNTNALTGPEEEEPPQKPSIVEQLSEFFQFQNPDPEAKVRIHFFDQFEFINGQIYFRHPELIPSDFKGYRIIHANGEPNPESKFKEKGLWYLNEHGTCSQNVVLSTDNKKK